MRIRCNNCESEYNVDDNRIPPQGVTIKCPKCLNSFVVKPGQPETSGAVPLPGGTPAQPQPGGTDAVALPGGAAQGVTGSGAVALPGSAPGGAVPGENSGAIALPGGAPAGSAPAAVPPAPPPVGGPPPMPGGQSGPVALPGAVPTQGAVALPGQGPPPIAPPPVAPPPVAPPPIAPPPVAPPPVAPPPLPPTAAPAAPPPIPPAIAPQTSPAQGIPLPGSAPQPGAIPLPGNTGVPLPGSPAVPLPGGPTGIPLPGAANNQAVPLPGEPPTSAPAGDLFGDAPGAPPPKSANVDNIFADVDQPSSPTADSVPAHPFHGESVVAEKKSIGGLIDFIDQQAPAAPESSTLNYQIRRRSGRVFGPYDKDTILKMLRKQELAGNEETSTDGQSWIPLSQIAVFAEEIQAITAAALGGLGDLGSLNQAPAGSNVDLPGLPNADLPGLPNADLPGLPNSDLPGLPNADLPGLPNSDLPGLPNSDLPGLPNSNLPGLPDNNLPGLTNRDLPEPYEPQKNAGQAPDPMADIGLSFSGATDEGASAPADDSPLGLLDVDLSMSTEERARKTSQRRVRPIGSRKVKSSPLVTILVAVGGVLILGGAAGVVVGLVTDHGWFGYKWVQSLFAPAPLPPPIDDDSKPKPPPPIDVPVDEVIARDTYVAYLQATTALKPQKGHPKTATQLANLYARLALLDEDKTAIPEGRAALVAAKGEAKTPEAIFAAAALEIVDGNCKTARALLSPLAGDSPAKEPKPELSDILALNGLALSCGKKANSTTGASFVDAALMARPTNTFAMWCQAQIADRAGDHKTAAGYFQKITEIQPKNARAALLYADQLVHLGGPAEPMFAAYQQAIDNSNNALAPWQMVQTKLGMARVHKKERDFDKAEQQTAEALEDGKHDLLSLSKVGQFALEIFAYELAKKAYAAVLKKSPGDNTAVIGQARALARTGDSLGAYNLVEKAAKKKPKDAELAHWLGWAYLEISKKDKAKAAFKKAHKLDPTISEPISALVSMDLELGKIKTAQDLINNSREKVGANRQGEMDLVQARVHKRARHFKKALASLHKAKDNNLDNGDSRALKGLILLETRKLKEATKLIDTAYKNDPRNPVRMVQKGRLLLRLGQPQPALELFESAVKADSKLAEYHIDVASAHIALDDMEAATTALTAASELSPKNPDERYYRGIALMEKDLTKSRVLLKEATNMSPEDARYWLELGRAFAAGGDYLDAIDHLKTAIRYDDQMAEAYYELGAAEIELLHYNDARSYLEQALRIDPSQAAIRIKIGQTLEKGGDFAGALKEYKAAIRTDPKLAGAYCRIGLVQKTNGKLKEAESALQKCLSFDRKHNEARKWLGYIYKDTKRRGQAIEMWKKHLSMFPDDLEAPMVREDLEDLQN